MKEALKLGDQSARLNVYIRPETVRNLRLFAVESQMTIAAAVDKLLAEGIARYVEGKDG